MRKAHNQLELYTLLETLKVEVAQLRLKKMELEDLQVEYDFQNKERNEARNKLEKVYKILECQSKQREYYEQKPHKALDLLDVIDLVLNEMDKK